MKAKRHKHRLICDQKHESNKKENIYTNMKQDNSKHMTSKKKIIIIKKVVMQYLKILHQITHCAVILPRMFIIKTLTDQHPKNSLSQSLEIADGI